MENEPPANLILGGETAVAKAKSSWRIETKNILHHNHINKIWLGKGQNLAQWKLQLFDKYASSNSTDKLLSGSTPQAIRHKQPTI